MYQEFIESIELDSTTRVAKSMAAIGEYDYSNISMMELEQIILELKPNSPKAITTICYIMSLFARHIGNDDMIYMLKDIDRGALWQRAKRAAARKFISNRDFEMVCMDIVRYEEHNALYQSSLFRCVYEGIYSDDMSAIKNLRASNVDGNVILMRHDNGATHELMISQTLASDLITMGEQDTWWRNNRYGAFKVRTKGAYEDSCFKVEDRNGSNEYQGRYSYYRILRKISKEYVGYGLLPLQLYVSGIMHRINEELSANGHRLCDAFADNNKNRFVSKTISDELNRTGYDIEVRNFREMVKGHIDVFDI